MEDKVEFFCMIGACIAAIILVLVLAIIWNTDFEDPDTRPMAETYQSDTKYFGIICVEGYEYITAHYKLAPKFNAEGKPSKC